VSIAAGGDNGAVRIAVENTGNTLPGEQMPHVFERFWRGAAAHTPAELHCGLGLSLSKAVIERLGGTIDAASPAVGVFLLTMRLPRDS
jgi:two-component system OmpR family sensor kinase